MYNVWENRLFKSGKTIRLRWDFCRSRISAGFSKKCRIPAGAGAEIRFSPTQDTVPSYQLWDASKQVDESTKFFDH